MNLVKKISISLFVILTCYGIFNITAMALTNDNVNLDNQAVDNDVINEEVEVDNQILETENNVVDETPVEVLVELEIHEDEIETLSFDEIDALVMNSCERYNNGETNKIDDSEYLSLECFEDDIVNQNSRSISASSENILEDKSYIYHKMINTVDYFDTVEGTYINKDNPNFLESTVQYQSDMINGNGYTRITQEDNDIEYYIENNLKSITVDNIYNDVYEEDMFELGDMVISDNDRIKISEDDGQNVYIYRNDRTNIAPASSQSVFPQGLAYGYLSDFSLWNIIDTTEYLNRNCVIIQGTSSTDYGSKLGVASFEMYVDIETGILLQYKGYDANSNLYCYTITQDISVNQPINIKNYSSNS